MSRSAERAKRRHGPALVLKSGRERSLALRHPWIFSGAIERVEGDPASGATVPIVRSDGEVVALAAYSPSSQIRARVWSFDPDAVVDAAFVARAVTEAAAMRKSMFDDGHDAARLVHGESDGIPGVIADRYRDVVVVQLNSAGAAFWRETIVDTLASLPGVRCVYERSDAEVRALEGLPVRTGIAKGDMPPDVSIAEGGIAYLVDPVAGQKTGFYLDQRDNRTLVRTLSAGKRVLNAFCYTGGFTLPALAGGARDVVSIDSAAVALAAGRRNLARNPQLDARRNAWVEADAFTDLRRLRNEAATFDLAILDPPKFAPTAAHAERAARAYKDINLLALKLLEPGGQLMTFSCSGGVSADLFQKIVAGAARDAGADVQIEKRLTASADHPVALDFPEGDYLKGLLLRKR